MLVIKSRNKVENVISFFMNFLVTITIAKYTEA